jgi:hypothetical protein
MEPIFRERSRIWGLFSCPGRHVKKSGWFPARGRQGGGVTIARGRCFSAAIGEAVVLSGVEERISFREAEAPAEPYIQQ